MADTNDLVFRFTSTATGISSLEEQDPPVAIFEVLEVKGREALSDLYTFDIELFSDDPFIDGFKLINKRATLEIDYKDDTAKYQGIIASFEEESRGRYRAILVPKVWTAGLTKQAQIFQEKDLATIVTDVLKENGLKENDDFSVTLKGKHPKHDYVVQYEESDLSFIRRLMEHEGAYFWFEHGEEKEKLIIRDVKDAHLAFQQDAEVLFRNPGFVADVEIISSMKAHHRVLPQKVILKDYNYRKPSLEMKATADAVKQGSGFVMEYGNHFKTPEEGNELAQVRADEIKCRETVYTGTGACRRFHPGYRFLLKDDLKIWRHEELELVLVSVQHFGKQEFMGRGRGDRRESGGRTTYHNDFEAITADLQFRPERKTPKPRLHGVMHANIDGSSSGQYAEIDDQGRYKVKLPFDLSDAPNAKASKFIRKAEPYAGANYGQHFPLHKGIEVLLTHVGGDLDRPLIDSAVANPETASPVTGSNHTKSVTRSAGGNEHVMEDLAGSERCHLSTPCHDSYVDFGSAHAEGKDVPPGITLGTKAGISINAGKGIAIMAGSGSGVHKDGISQGTQVADNLVAAIAAVAAVAALGSGLAAEKAAAGTVAKVAAAADLAGTIGGVLLPSVYIGAPGKVFCGGGAEVIVAAGLTLDMGAIGPANIMSVAGVLVAGLMHVSVVGGGPVEAVSVKGDVKLHAKLKNVNIKGRQNVLVYADTKSFATKAKENVALTAQTKDLTGKAKKNVKFKAQTENFEVRANKTIKMRAETQNLDVKAKLEAKIVAQEKDFLIEATTTKLTLKAGQELKLECGDSHITLMADGRINIMGKEIFLEAEKSDLKMEGDGFELTGGKGNIHADTLDTEATKGGQFTIKGGMVKINS